MIMSSLPFLYRSTRWQQQDHGFKHWLGQPKNYKIGIYCFSWSVSKHYKNPIKSVGLVQSGHHLVESLLLSPWYGWLIAYLVLNNTHASLYFIENTKVKCSLAPYIKKWTPRDQIPYTMGPSFVKDWICRSFINTFPLLALKKMIF